MTTNGQWLYQTDEQFREAVQQAACEWLGSTSRNFADAWLRETHGGEKGQHVDDDLCIETVRRYVDRRGEVSELREELEKRDKGIERLRRRRDELQAERDALMARLTDADGMTVAGLRSIAEKYRQDAIESQKETEKYRELCGRFRSLANQMLGMEVD